MQHGRRERCLPCAAVVRHSLYECCIALLSLEPGQPRLLCVAAYATGLRGTLEGFEVCCAQRRRMRRDSPSARRRPFPERDLRALPHIPIPCTAIIRAWFCHVSHLRAVCFALRSTLRSYAACKIEQSISSAAPYAGPCAGSHVFV